MTISSDERARLRGLAEHATARLRDDMHTTVWDTVSAVPALLDALEEAEADRDRWRREFDEAAKYVEECARLWAEVRRLEREAAERDDADEDRRYERNLRDDS
jgi:hypothetical protein